MNLNETQQQAVGEWISAGMKLAEVQSRLEADFGLILTYMEVRFLVDDLKLRLQDPEPPKPTTPPASESTPELPPELPAGAVPGSGQVSVTVDQLARPGTLVSGAVTFSDGMSAEWYLDQTGRLGLVPKKQGYKPTPADIQQFQSALEREMAKQGL